MQPSLHLHSSHATVGEIIGRAPVQGRRLAVSMTRVETVRDADAEEAEEHDAAAAAAAAALAPIGPRTTRRRKRSQRRERGRGRERARSQTTRRRALARLRLLALARDSGGARRAAWRRVRPRPRRSISSVLQLRLRRAPRGSPSVA
eukprot:scaffold306_cov525-Prasinococcus_capsulatus_cf.AAC.13